MGTSLCERNGPASLQLEFSDHLRIQLKARYLLNPLDLYTESYSKLF
jgi:hypothetical protein